MPAGDRQRTWFPEMGRDAACGMESPDVLGRLDRTLRSAGQRTSAHSPLAQHHTGHDIDVVALLCRSDGPERSERFGARNYPCSWTVRHRTRSRSQVVGEALEKIPRVDRVRSSWEAAPLTGTREHDVNHLIELDSSNSPIRRETALRRRSVQSQADSGLSTQLIPVAFRRVNHTFLYLYPRDR